MSGRNSTPEHLTAQLVAIARGRSSGDVSSANGLVPSGMWSLYRRFSQFQDNLSRIAAVELAAGKVESGLEVRLGLD